MLLAGIYVLLLPLIDDEGTLTSMQDLTLLGCRVFWLQIVPALFQSSRNLLPSTVLVLVSLPCICRMWGQSFTGLAPAALSMFLSLFVSCVVVFVCVCVLVLVVVCLSMFLFLSCGICRMWGQSFAGLAPAACSHFRPLLPYQFTLIPTHNAHSTST